MLRNKAIKFALVIKNSKFITIAVIKVILIINNFHIILCLYYVILIGQQLIEFLINFKSKINALDL